MPFSHYAISFLTDDLIRMRYVEIDGQLRKVAVVVNMRGGNHSKCGFGLPGCSGGFSRERFADAFLGVRWAVSAG